MMIYHPMCFGEKVTRNQTWHIAIKDETLGATMSIKHHFKNAWCTLKESNQTCVSSKIVEIFFCSRSG